jgi:hypothetical protein
MLPLVLSSDSHVFEPPDLWQTRIDAAFRDRARGSCGAEGNYKGLLQSSDRGRLRLYLLQPRLNFIEIDHTVPIINDYVAVEVDPATDERDISGRQAARHSFMWLRSHGYRRSGAPGAAAAIKSADFDPHIVRITVVFGNPHRHRQAGQARRELHFRPILGDGFRSGRVFKIVRHIRVADPSPTALTYWARPRASREVFADFRSAAFTHAAMIEYADPHRAAYR